MAGPDARLNAFRADLADDALRDVVQAARYVQPSLAEVVVSIAPVRRQGSSEAALDTEALFGERVHVFETAAGWAWVQLLRDRYVGYVPADCLRNPGADPTHRISVPATFVFPRPDLKSPPLMSLPLGAMVVLGEADGRFASLQSGGFVFGAHVSLIAQPANDWVAIAEAFIGTPYLWGGRTRLGIDCSGLVQSALEAGGMSAPRDSDMQEAELGSVIPASEGKTLQRGDLVFWPGHVGIMTDPQNLLHANAHHMMVAREPLSEAVQRIASLGGTLSVIKRLAPAHT